MPDEVVIDIRLRVEDLTFLQELELVYQEHHDDRNYQRNKRAVERRAETLRNARDIPVDRPVRLPQCFADPVGIRRTCRPLTSYLANPEELHRNA